MQSLQCPARIFELVLSHLQPMPALAPATAGGGPCRYQGRYQGPVRDSAELLAHLQESFSVELLRQSGVITDDGDGVLRLTPELIDGPATFEVLWSANGEPLEMLTPDGLLGVVELPLFAEARRRSNFMVSPSLDDVAVLRSWGFAATLASGLDDMCAADLHRFLRLMKFDPEDGGLSTDYWFDSKSFLANPDAKVHPDNAEAVAGDSDVTSEDETAPPSVIIVGWSPAELSKDARAGIPPIADFFEKVHKFHRIVESPVYIWVPKDFERLRFLASHGDIPSLRQAIVESLDNNTSDVLYWNCPRPRAPLPPANFIQATQELFQVARKRPSNESDLKKLRDAWACFENFLNLDVIQPLLHETKKISDPTLRNLHYVLAHLSQTWHVHAAVIQIESLHSGLSRGVPVIPKGKDSPLPDFQRLTDRIRGLTQEIQECKRRNQKIAPAWRRRRFDFQRSANLN